MLVGYARVSTSDQTTGLQLDALDAAGCERVYKDEAISGSTTSRPGLDKALAELKAGDTLIVWKLDRLGRDLRHLVNVVAELTERGIGFKVLTGQGAAIDTTTASGKLIFGIFAALAEFERELIIERTNAGLAAAKRRGTLLGRRRAIAPSKLDHARTLIEGGETIASVAHTLRVHRRTLERALKRA